MPEARRPLDRRGAGRQLAAALVAYRYDDVVVLALPRGGVPVGYEVARAVPVAPPDVCEELALEADDFVCLSPPLDFHAVGFHHVDFAQVSDDEVAELLEAASQQGLQQR